MLRQAAEWTFLKLSLASSHRPKTTLANQAVVANVSGEQKFANKTAADTRKTCQIPGFSLKQGVESFLGLPAGLSTSGLISQASPRSQEQKRRMPDTLEPV